MRKSLRLQRIRPRARENKSLVKMPGKRKSRKRPLVQNPAAIEMPRSEAHFKQQILSLTSSVDLLSARVEQAKSRVKEFERKYGKSKVTDKKNALRFLDLNLGYHKAAFRQLSQAANLLDFHIRYNEFDLFSHTDIRWLMSERAKNNAMIAWKKRQISALEKLRSAVQKFGTSHRETANAFETFEKIGAPKIG